MAEKVDGGWMRKDGTFAPSKGAMPRHKDFVIGNLEHLTHGAYCDRVVSPRGEAILEQYRIAAPWLAPVDIGALRDLARTEARVELLETFLAERDDGTVPGVSAKGAVQAAADYLLKLQKHATTLRSRLGFDPLSRAKLGRDVAATKVSATQVLAQLAKEASVDGEVVNDDS